MRRIRLIIEYDGTEYVGWQVQPNGIAIDSGLDKIGERERSILKLRFFDGKTQTEVAKEIGISQAQVSRLEKTALKAMRKYI